MAEAADGVYYVLCWLKPLAEAAVGRLKPPLVGWSRRWCVGGLGPWMAHGLHRGPDGSLGSSSGGPIDPMSLCAPSFCHRRHGSILTVVPHKSGAEFAAGMLCKVLAPQGYLYESRTRL